MSKREDLETEWIETRLTVRTQFGTYYCLEDVIDTKHPNVFRGTPRDSFMVAYDALTNITINGPHDIIEECRRIQVVKSPKPSRKPKK